MYLGVMSNVPKTRYALTTGTLTEVGASYIAPMYLYTLLLFYPYSLSLPRTSVAHLIFRQLLKMRSVLLLDSRGPHRNVPAP